MAIKRIPLDESDEDRGAREEQEESSRVAEQERVAALEAKARAEELRAAKAEAALDEARRVKPQETTNSQPQITEEQWQQAETRTGKTRDQIIADANLQQGMINSALKPVLDEVKSAREEARAAKAETASIKARRGLDTVESDFYEKNPALKGHKKDVDDFLATYPDNGSVDGETLKKRLAVAQDVVKGRVKDNMNTRKRTNGSARLETSRADPFEDESEDEEGSFDPTGLDGQKGARYLMEGVAANPGGRLSRGEDTVKEFKKFRDSEGRGVVIDDSDEWARGEQIRRGSDRLGGRGNR